MKKILYALLVAVSGLFSACDNEDSAPFAPISDICSRSSDVTEYLNITYKDTTYLDVPTTYDENGDFIFMDEECHHANASMQKLGNINLPYKFTI